MPRSRDALRDHLAARRFNVWRATWATLQIHDRKLASYEIGDSEPV
jgi:hypothetical protein